MKVSSTNGIIQICPFKTHENSQLQHVTTPAVFLSLPKESQGPLALNRQRLFQKWWEDLDGQDGAAVEGELKEGIYVYL